jgi:hypothetical protein
MGKMKELSQMIDTLITCGETLAETGNALKAFFSYEEEMPKDEAKPVSMTAIKKENPDSTPEQNTYSKEDVRGILAAKANESNGRFKASVKALVKKYGNGGSLTDIPAESYPELIKEVEGLTDA